MATKITKSGTYTGTAGADTFSVDFKPTSSTSLSIDGSTSSLNNAGTAGSGTGTSSDITTSLGYNTDTKLTLAYRPGSTTSIDTNATVVAGYNAQDILKFTKSGDYSTLGAFFNNIETLQLSSGVRIQLSSDVFEAIGTDMDRGAVNYGFTIEGVAGGKEESVTFVTEWEDTLTDPAVGRSYLAADVQLDDYSFADLYHNVSVSYDFRTDADDLEDEGVQMATYDRYARMDGANSDEKVYGSSGVDNATMRLGNDTYFGYAGNDLLIGHGGADSLDGGDGNDVFTIGGFGTGTSGTTSKADDGKAEWIISAAEGTRTGVTNGITNATDYDSQYDIIKGGTGFDTLRITTGIGATGAANGTVVLNDKNFISMEKVEVGGTISRDADESTYQQIADGHYLLAKNSTVSDTATSAGGTSGNSINNVVIDASGVTKKGLIFEGNGNTNKFIGTTQADTFITNGGHDTVTGGDGADKFVFQTIREYARDSGTANGAISYTSTDTALTSAASDSITDFVTGTDTLVFRVESTTTLEETFDSLVALTKGALTSTNVLVGDLTSVDTAGTTASYIKADTTGSDVNVYYDADGSGAGAAVLVATLVGVSTVSASDFVVAAVQNF